MCFGCLYSLGVGFSPYLAADLIQRFHSPLNDMEGVDTTLAGGCELIHTVRDPSGAVSGNDLYTGELPGRQLAVKLFQDLLAVSLGRPDDGVGIVIDNDRDVLVAFPVTGLINTNVDKVIKASGTLRLDLVQRSVDTAADSFPVDPHVFGDGTPRQVDSEPSDSQVEVLREAAPGISPGNVRNEDAMFRAQETVRAVLDLDQRSAPVEGTPGAGETGLDIIGFATLMAERAIILMPLVRAGMDPEVIHTVGILIKIVSGDNCGLDTE